MKQLVLATLLATTCHVEPPAPINVAAAASMQDAVRVVAARYEAKTHRRIALNFAASNVLARQINAGAPVDVFISADQAQGDAVQALERRPLASNFLALVSIRRIHDVEELRSMNRIAIGDPEAGVPAGVYAKQFMKDLRMWDELAPKVVPMEDVRAALAAADRGSVDAAWVYRTDVAMAKRAKIDFWIEARPILYPACLIQPEGKAFYDYLFTDESLALFKKYGFGPPSGVWEGPAPKMQ